MISAITEAGQQALTGLEDNTYLLVQTSERPTEIARSFGPLPLHFQVKHAEECSDPVPLGICPCKPPAMAEAITDLQGNVLWQLMGPPMLVPGDSMTFTWEIR